MSSIFFQNFQFIFNRGGEEITHSIQRGLLWPLRDWQDTPARWYCARCGGEQYREDRSVLRHGMALCQDCLSQSEEEEEQRTP